MVLHDAFVILLLLHCARDNATRSRCLGILAVRLRLLLRFLALAQRLRQELLELGVLQRLLGLHELGLVPYRWGGDHRRATREECDRKVESSNEGVRGREATRAM